MVIVYGINIFTWQSTAAWLAWLLNNIANLGSLGDVDIGFSKHQSQYCEAYTQTFRKHTRSVYELVSITWYESHLQKKFHFAVAAAASQKDKEAALLQRSGVAFKMMVWWCAHKACLPLIFGTFIPHICFKIKFQFSENVFTCTFKSSSASVVSPQNRIEASRTIPLYT